MSMSEASRVRSPHKHVLEADFPHPGDAHLCTVLVELEDEGDHKFVTWMYNRTTRGYAHGHYFEWRAEDWWRGCRSRDEAERMARHDWAERVRKSIAGWGEKEEGE